MRQLFNLLPKPSRYIGIEEGAVHKDPQDVRLRIALAFPDLYEVGMSYLGQKILYGIINDHPLWWAERVFAPCTGAAAVLRQHEAPLCSLESDTPLADFDLVGFSLTHELCYTNVLYMLDLAGIPFRSADRLQGNFPLIIAGGGCTLSAEPAAAFFDAMLLGDGEEILPEFLRLILDAQGKRRGKMEVLELAAALPGVYVPLFFQDDGPRRPPLPLRGEYASITRRAVQSLDSTAYPSRQVIPFGAVHNRLALEIARGCTRGCRFCQAGMIYRPVRERDTANLQQLLDRCLNDTGYEDVSYLSLSTGDFSALKTFFNATIHRCAAEQISVSLPSLRVGSIDDGIMEKMADIRRTGATLAPEAGSQRLRDVINKGISEEDVILHTQKLFEHGWQQIKLYFMIGLPTETDEDLLAIIDLCRKVRDAAGSGVKRLQVTAALSPFVPKAHTPFQWEAQVEFAEIQRRIGVLLKAVQPEKRIKLRWHNPEMSFLEGLLSRGDRRLTGIVERAYRKGAVFASWIDQFSLTPWLEALDEEGVDSAFYAAAFAPGDPLPWDHLRCGVKTSFLRAERERALQGLPSPDCRYHSCLRCGVCHTGHANILNFPQRDQEAHRAALDQYGRVIPRSTLSSGKKNLPPALAADLIQKKGHYQVYYAKTKAAVCLSQLEIQSIFERALRRGKIPLAFSQGFNPAPLLSFSRALPVGVASLTEWFSLYLRENVSLERIRAAFGDLPLGLDVTEVREISLEKRPAEALAELYRLEWTGREERRKDFTQACAALADLPDISWIRPGKKQEQEIHLRSGIRELIPQNNVSCLLHLDWTSGYISPLFLVRAALGLSWNGDAEAFSIHEFLLTKLPWSAGVCHA